jgi:hypothetical protein
MMDILEYEQYAEAFEWALANKPLLKSHEPVLLRFINQVEARIDARLKALGIEEKMDETAENKSQ